MLFQKKIPFIVCLTILISCGKDSNTPSNPTNTGGSSYNLNTSPSWTTQARIFLKGAAGSFDAIAVKDPSIVYADGKWHLFFTGKDAANWRMGYASSAIIDGLKTAGRTYMSALNGGTYFCAPQLFYSSTQSKWYLVYQSGLGATYSTNTDISNPAGWTAGAGMGFGDGIDFWCISDGARVYCFYSAQDGSRTIKMRSTAAASFPAAGWTAPTVVATEAFESPHVYKNKADGKYYMMIEDFNRHFEIWKSNNLDGIWLKQTETWAAKSNLTELAEHWTDQVSHGEIIRTGADEKCEVDDLNRCQILIQGVVNGSYPSYGLIPYELGVIKNY